MQVPPETLSHLNTPILGLVDPKLTQRQERIKWKAINSLDIEKIVENTDILSLEQILPSLINCKISKEEFQRADKASLAKLLQVFQLSLEYFSYTHNYLANLKDKLSEQNTEMENQVNR